MPSISIPAGQEHEGGKGNNGQERRGVSHDASLWDEVRTENPASNRPKDGALHLGGMTSLRADRATATQFTNPVPFSGG